jgi:hypothetical protein
MRIFLIAMMVCVSVATQVQAGEFSSLLRKKNVSCEGNHVVTQPTKEVVVVEEKLVKKYEPVVVYREKLVKEKVVKRYEVPCEPVHVSECEFVQSRKLFNPFGCFKKKRRPVAVYWAAPYNPCDAKYSSQEVGDFNHSTNNPVASDQMPLVPSPTPSF